MEQDKRSAKIRHWKSILRAPFARRDPDLWLFGSWLGKKYRDNSMEFFEWVCANKPEIKAVWVTKDDIIYDYLQGRNLDVVHDLKESDKADRLLKKAGLAVISVSQLDITDRFEYLYGANTLQLWHGIPIKGIGNIPPPRKTGKVRILLRRLMRLESAQYSTAAGDYLLAPTRLYFSKETEMPVLGYPNHDACSLDRPCGITEDVERRFPGCTKILYMPTFRMSRDKGIPFRPFSCCGFDVGRMNDVLSKNNMVFMCKGHFWDGGLSENLGCDRIIDVEDTSLLNNIDLMKHVDILITDYSSVLYDFLFLGKPVIKFPFDYDDYLQDRGIVVDYEALPGTTVMNWEELCACLENRSYRNPTEGERSFYFKYTDNQACARIFDYVRSHWR